MKNIVERTRNHKFIPYLSFIITTALVVLFSTAQQTYSSPEFAENDGNLQDGGDTENEDSGLFTAVTRPSSSQLPNDPIARSRFVTINENARSALPTNPDYAVQQIKHLNLFEDVILTAELDRIEVNRSGSYSWIGHVAGAEFSDVILVINGPYLTGHITTSTGTYNITPVTGNIHRIAEINSSAILTGEDDSVKVEIPEEDNPITLAPQASDDGSVIDVMIVYTDDAVAAHGLPILQSWIELYIAYTNQAYINSNIAQRISLVHTQEVAYTEPGDLDPALDDLKNTSHPELGVVHTWRNTYHADLVLMLVNDDGSGSCGGLASVPVTITPGFESSSFGTMEACSFGASVFAHELGHNMGSNHDWYVDADITPFTYAHGYVDTTNKFRTIMSYNNRCGNLGISCREIVYFANPSLNFAGNPTGIPDSAPSNCTTDSHPDTECQADVRQTFNNTNSNSAIFRSSQITWIGNNNNWHDASNWVTNEGPPSGTTPVNRVPRDIDNVLIPTTPTGGNFPTISANTNVRDVTIQTGATLNMTAGTLNVYGNWEETGTGALNASGGTVVFKGTLPQTITSNSTLLKGRAALTSSIFNNVQIGDGGSTFVTLNSNIDVNGNLTIQGRATLKAGSNNIKVAGNWSDQSGIGFLPGSSTVVFDGTTQSADKIASATIYSENFNGSSSDQCGTTLPPLWDSEKSAGFGVVWCGTASFAPGTIAYWDDTPDGWAYSPALQLAIGVTYQLQYKYRVYFSGSDTFNAYLSSEASSASMLNTTPIHSATGSGTQQTATVQFTVPSDGTYFLGFRSQGSNTGAIDDVIVTGIGKLTFNNITVASGTTSFSKNLNVNGNLVTNSGATANLGSNEAFIEGTVINNGTLQQTRDISDGSGNTTYDFLILTNAAQSVTKYYGAQLTPDGGQPLGSTIVQVSGHQNCTSNAADPLIQRCFNIAPTSAQSATIKYWFVDAERNGQTQNQLNVWDYNNMAWVQVGTTASYGANCLSDTTCWLEWTGIDTFSPMVAGSGAAPTGTPGGSTCAAPGAVTTLAASRTGTTVNLNWTGSGADVYEIHRKVNDPYFTPGASTLVTTIAGTSYPDPGKLGNPPMNYSYVVVAKNNCGGGMTAVPSNRVGEFDFGIVPGSGGGPQTYIYNDQPAGGVAITDLTCDGGEIVRTFSVGDTFTISDLNVGFNANHTWRGDIRVTLQSPTGTLKQLIADISDNDENYDILLDGDSGGAIDSGSADDTDMPYYDRTVMQALLDDFDGEAGNGTWTLRICDNAGGDTGTYNHSRLVFTGN